MRNRKGAVTIEFALVGVPLIFAIVSIVQMSQAMWTYFTQAYAINGALRYVVVHGEHCAESGNTCTVTVGNIASQIAALGSGLAPGSWNVKLISATPANSVTCNPLSSCSGKLTVWPPSPDNKVGTAVAISGSYPFQSALMMFWPGAKPTTFGTYNMTAYGQHVMEF